MVACRFDDPQGVGEWLLRLFLTYLSMRTHKDAAEAQKLVDDLGQKKIHWTEYVEGIETQRKSRVVRARDILKRFHFSAGSVLDRTSQRVCEFQRAHCRARKKATMLAIATVAATFPTCIFWDAMIAKAAQEEATALSVAGVFRLGRAVARRTWSCDNPFSTRFNLRDFYTHKKSLEGKKSKTHVRHAVKSMENCRRRTLKVIKKEKVSDAGESGYRRNGESQRSGFCRRRRWLIRMGKEFGRLACKNAHMYLLVMGVRESFVAGGRETFKECFHGPGAYAGFHLWSGHATGAAPSMAGKQEGLLMHELQQGVEITKTLVRVLKKFASSNLRSSLKDMAQDLSAQDSCLLSHVWCEVGKLYQYCISGSSKYERAHLRNGCFDEDMEQDDPASDASDESDVDGD